MDDPLSYFYDVVIPKTAQYPPATGLIYLTLGLAAEAGEVAGKLAKHYRGDYDRPTAEAKMIDELGDVMWFWIALCKELGISPQEVIGKVVSKLMDRVERGVIKGDGDKR